MRNPDDIATALAAFDGKHVAPLRDCMAEPLDQTAITALLHALPGDHEIGATWMLKALAEQKALPAEAEALLAAKLPVLTEPDAILHLLQMVQHWPPGRAMALRPALTPLYRHPRGLVRVWAFDAYCRGAETPEDIEDVKSRIQVGLTDRFAAMRARARALDRVYGSR